MKYLQKRARGARRWWALPAVLLAVGPMAACDTLLDVELPGQMTEGDVYQPELAQTLVNSAIADFECAYSMASVVTASMEDTWWRGTGYWGGWAEYRQIRPDSDACGTADTSDSWYQAMQTSRFLAEEAYEHISGWSDEEVANRQQLLAASAVYAGLAYQFFGETYCELAVNVGPLMTDEEVLDEAESWFTTALQHIQQTGDFSIATTESVKQLAHLGRARVRLARGDLQGAAADARQVEPGFVAWVTRDPSVRPRWNHTFRQLNVSLYSSIAGPVEHQGEIVPFTNYRYLIFDELGRANVDGFPVAEPVPDDPIPGYMPENVDPRVPVVFTGEFLQDGVTDNWQQRKYTSYGDPIPLARWAEAQLILAEIEGGAAAVEHVNNLRDVHELPHYRGPVDPASIRNMIIEERRREFFFEGRFLADKHRYGLWFPEGIGANHKGFTYGNATCYLMPISEYETNPNLPDP